MLKVEDLAKEYRMGRERLRVLKGVSLQVETGEFVAVMGPSGAGKSTLLHLMGILDTPTEGRIVYKDTDLADLGRRRQAYWRNRLFGFVFQFYHLLPDFTALENVYLPGLANVGLLGWREHKKGLEKRGRNLLEMVGLADRAAHRPSELSGGERQRVAIARALITRPEVLLCDEPTGNMDTETGDRVLNLLGSLRQETGCTVVMATHDERVASSAERVIELVDGRVVGAQQ